MKRLQLFIVITLAAALLAGCQDTENTPGSSPTPVQEATVTPAQEANATSVQGATATPAQEVTTTPAQEATTTDHSPAAAPSAETSGTNNVPANTAKLDLPQLTYTEEQKTEILKVAEQAGLDQVYIPTVGLGTDDYLDRIEVQEDTVRIVFIRGAISQSRHDLRPVDGAPSRSVLLPNGITAEWIKQEESTVEFLYFEKDGVYFSFTSARAIIGEEYEAAAGSLQPLK
ncbi:hypothetical protein [Paenibacillus tepidiphilus]|uniref:hypothetical protein n=1 Tax=Paenibacillus tepidiphilus TaxID=2608683 RepID=UPI00123AE53F|nr:hypothetical protein [Paenibacillus tepidiphilus]